MFHKRSTEHAKEGFRRGNEYFPLEGTGEAQGTTKPVSSLMKWGWNQWVVRTK